ncbi:endolytic transglycosylase MltG, partial [bacterium]|nr:endolytic transglycosylase MltG [bacterium]
MDKSKVEGLKKFLQDVNKNNYVFIAVVLIAILVTLRLFIIFTPVNIRPQQMKIIIPRGANLSQIAGQLVDQKIINNSKSFVLAAHLMLKNRQLKAGFFNLQNVRDYRSLIHTLATSQVHVIKVTVPEGYQAKQIARLVAGQLNFEAGEFFRLLDDEKILNDLEIESPSLEGYLFPETYYFNDSDNPEDVIRRMVGLFNEMVTD